MPSPLFIVGRAPGDDDPVVRDGEIVRVPLLLRDGFTINAGGGLMMADGTSLEHRLRFASPAGADRARPAGISRRGWSRRCRRPPSRLCL